jgi:hypothetical protein
LPATQTVSLASLTLSSLPALAFSTALATFSPSPALREGEYDLFKAPSFILLQELLLARMISLLTSLLTSLLAPGTVCDSLPGFQQHFLDSAASNAILFAFSQSCSWRATGLFDKRTREQPASLVSECARHSLTTRTSSPILGGILL